MSMQRARRGESGFLEAEGRYTRSLLLSCTARRRPRVGRSGCFGPSAFFGTGCGMRTVAVLLAILGAGPGTAFGQSTPQSPDALRPAAAGAAIDLESGSRLPLLTRADMPDATSARIYDALA